MYFNQDEVVERRWMISEAALDDEQYQIRNLKKDQSFLVDGCAGSGKTVLALQKAQELQASGIDSYLVIIFTKTLTSFVKDGIIHFDIDPDKVWNYHQLANSGYEKVDYIIVDEIQDFSEEQIHKMLSFASISFMFFGDDAQKLYEIGLGIEEIKKISGLPTENHKKLYKNYRLPKNIAKFSSHIKGDYDLVERCVKEEGEKPVVKKFNHFHEELHYIKEMIENEYWRDVAIFFSNNDEVIYAGEQFKKIGLDVEIKANRKDKKPVEELVFFNSKPKLMTYHSSKGLQFEHVFMPSCEIDSNEYRYREAVYVATTRASETLHITYSGTLSPFIASIPKDLSTNF